MYFRKREPVPPGLMAQLKQRQLDLQQKIKLQPLKGEPKIVAACDTSLTEEDVFSVFVVFNWPEMEVIEIKHHQSKIELPYIPGFLAFREVPNLLKAYELLVNEPELIFVDGHGIAHPRKLGIATHLGVLIDKPTIGIAKSILVGNFAGLSEERGSVADLVYKDSHIGFAVRGRDKVKPVFVSPGHLVDFADALKFSLMTLGKYRLPEPTRIADLYSKQLKPNARK